MVALAALLVLQSTGFDKPITLECKDTLLTVVLKQISKDCGVEIVGPAAIDNRKVTVLVKDMKTRALLDRIASLYALDGTVTENRYTFALGLELRRGYFQEYVGMESQLRINLAIAKLSALAKLTL